jgi:hypothetical protein
VLASTVICCALAAATPAPSATEAYDFATALARAGPRPAGSAAERRAHRRVAQRFRAAGLRVGYERFAVPGHGRSRDVIGIRDAPADCLVIAMAHADSVPPAPGADDNASGVGTLVALAKALGSDQTPACDVWLVVTGSEERPYTRQPDHLGAAALVRRLRRTNRLDDVALALSLDEVGRGARFELRSPVARPRPAVEGRILDAARRANVTVRWLRDTGTGNSRPSRARARRRARREAWRPHRAVPAHRLRHRGPPAARRLRARAARRVAAATRMRPSARPAAPRPRSRSGSCSPAGSSA